MVVLSAVERRRHIHDSQGQALALAFRQTSLTPFKPFPLRSEADTLERRLAGLPDQVRSNQISRGRHISRGPLRRGGVRCRGAPRCRGASDAEGLPDVEGPLDIEGASDVEGSPDVEGAAPDPGKF